MNDPTFLPGLLAVVVVAGVVVVALLVMGLSRPGSRRAGLVAGGVPLALVVPAVAAAWTSHRLIGLFARAAAGASGTIPDAGPALGTLMKAAAGGFTAACVVGFLLGLLGSGREDDEAPVCSSRRGAVLLLLPLLGLLVAGTLMHVVGSALRVTTAVAAVDPDDPDSRSRGDALLEAAGFSARGPGSIGAVSRFLTRATMLGTFGGVTGVVVLLGLALPGFILAWPVRFGRTFRVLSSAAWLLAATLGSLVSFGLV